MGLACLHRIDVMPDPSFAEFFEAVHGVRPFPWQVDVAERACDGDWPSSIVVPTGMGKTSVLDAAVYALARQADRPASKRTAPTRAALVVDRRLVVDSAFAHASKVRQALKQPATSACRWVSERLLSVSALGESPLEVVRMRGGVTWAARWLRSPDQPAIVIGTVDQFGSRLLFRGYGQSDRMRPIDAALVGTDMVCLLDEAHMSQPLVDTVLMLRRIESVAPQPVGRPLQIVEMSATPRSEGDAADVMTRVQISDRDLDSSASDRLTATKRAVMVQLDDKLAKQPAAAMAAVASAVLARHPTYAIGVVVNTVALARQVFDTLPAGVDKALAIGRCRPADRSNNQPFWLARTQVGRDRAAASGFILVATQTIEVGVDLDLDVLISQSAPIDSLVQRFGRVDRIGVLGETTSYVVATGLPEVVYREPERRTWAALTSLSHPVLMSDDRHTDNVLDGDTAVDFGTLLMGAWMQERDLVPLIAESAPSPLPTAATISWWRRTAPVPEPDEDVSPYLHGVGRWSPTVSVLWRCDLIEGDADASMQALARLPPDSAEMVEVSLVALRAFLAGAAAEVSDVEGVELAADPPSGGVARVGCVLHDGNWNWIPGSAVRPGDVVVLPSSYGGHDNYGWTGRIDEPVVDLGGLTGPRGRRFRLDTYVLAQLGAGDWHQLVAEVLAVDELTNELRSRIANRLSETASNSPYRALLTATTEWITRAVWDPEFDANGVRVRLDLVESGQASRFVATSDDGTESTSRILVNPAPVVLSQHLVNVGDRSERHASKLGLSAELVAAVRLAGRFHDLGKADVRFQTLLHNGRRHRAEAVRFDADRALAKSERLSPGSERAIIEQSGWPRGLRHEAVSLALVRAAPDLLFDGVDRALVEHLVASHHGHARPLFSAVVDTAPDDVAITFDGITFRASIPGLQNGLDHASTFDALCGRYGSWGLALLESIVRLSDMSVSEDGS
jgi:CRISPR-associated endonuclease/helicase Cas3